MLKRQGVGAIKINFAAHAAVAHATDHCHQWRVRAPPGASRTASTPRGVAANPPRERSTAEYLLITSAQCPSGTHQHLVISQHSAGTHHCWVFTSTEHLRAYQYSSLLSTHQFPCTIFIAHQYSPVPSTRHAAALSTQQQPVQLVSADEY